MGGDEGFCGGEGEDFGGAVGGEGVGVGTHRRGREGGFIVDCILVFAEDGAFGGGDYYAVYGGDGEGGF